MVILETWNRFISKLCQHLEDEARVPQGMFLGGKKCQLLDTWAFDPWLHPPRYIDSRVNAACLDWVCLESPCVVLLNVFLQPLPPCIHLEQWGRNKDNGVNLGDLPFASLGMFAWKRDILSCHMSEEFTYQRPCCSPWWASSLLAACERAIQVNSIIPYGASCGNCAVSRLPTTFVSTRQLWSLTWIACYRILAAKQNII